MRSEEHARKEVERLKQKLENDPAVDVFLKYLNVRTQAVYLEYVSQYFDWLKDVKGSRWHRARR